MLAIHETRAPPRAGAPPGRGMRAQARRTLRSPDAPSPDCRLPVVTGATGATAGIGLESARGLYARGADLVPPCRSRDESRSVAWRLRAEMRTGGLAGAVATDLADLDTVESAAIAIERPASGWRIDLLVESAGIWPARYALRREPSGTRDRVRGQLRAVPESTGASGGPRLRYDGEHGPLAQR